MSQHSLSPSAAHNPTVMVRDELESQTDTQPGPPPATYIMWPSGSPVILPDVELTPPSQNTLKRIPVHLKDDLMTSQEVVRSPEYKGIDIQKSVSKEKTTKKRGIQYVNMSSDSSDGPQQCPTDTTSSVPNQMVQGPKRPLTPAERQRISRAKRAAKAKQQQESEVESNISQAEHQIRSQSLPSHPSTSTSEKKPMTAAERKRISRAKKAAEPKQLPPLALPNPGQSSQSDTEELPSPPYVPMIRQHSATSTNQRRKPMTGAERKRASRARETKQQTERRLEEQQLRNAARREAETDEQTQRRL